MAPFVVVCLFTSASMNVLRNYIKILLREEFFYYGPGHNFLPKVLGSSFGKNRNKKQDLVNDLVERWISSLEKKLDFEFSAEIEEHIKKKSAAVYPRLLKSSGDHEEALEILWVILNKKFRKPLEKISKKYLKEIAGDYKMSGTRRMDAPGNIRSGFQTMGSRSSIENDSSSEEGKLAQNKSVLPAAAVTFLSKGGKVLAVSRGNDLSNLNMPGGGVEPGEDPKDAAIRELQEETGLIAHDAIPLGEFNDNGRVVHLFRVTSWGGKLSSSPEGFASWEDPRTLSGSEFGKTFNHVLEVLSGDVISKNG